MARNRRRRPLPPQHDAHMQTLSDYLDTLIKRNAENRMKVFDAAPLHVRTKTNYLGGAEGEPLNEWWGTLQKHQQEAVLAGKPLPKPISNIWDQFF